MRRVSGIVICTAREQFPSVSKILNTIRQNIIYPAKSSFQFSLKRRNNLNINNNNNNYYYNNTNILTIVNVSRLIESFRYISNSFNDNNRSENGKENEQHDNPDKCNANATSSSDSKATYFDVQDVDPTRLEHFYWNTSSIDADNDDLKNDEHINFPSYLISESYERSITDEKDYPNENSRFVHPKDYKLIKHEWLKH